MRDQVVTFALASISKRMTVQFSPEGHDVVCALLMKWLRQVSEAHASAVEMERLSENPLMRGQALYWQHAGSFLKSKLYGHLTHKFNCYNEVKELAKLRDGGQIPDGWEAFDTAFTPVELPDGPTSSTPGGTGSDCDGANGNAQVGAGRRGAGGAGEADSGTPAANPAVVGKSARKKSVRSGKGGNDADRRRGGQRKPTGEKAGRDGGKTAKTVGD